MQVCAGHVHTLALTEDGEVFAWGNNKTGCVGCEERGTCRAAARGGSEGQARGGDCRGNGVLGGADGGGRGVHLVGELGDIKNRGADNYGQLARARVRGT